MFHFDRIQRKLLLIIGAIILMLSIGLIYRETKNRPDSSLQEASAIQQQNLEQDGEALKPDLNENISQETNQDDTIQIYITGQVTRPGVYAISSEKRLVDAIELAGGCTPHADLTLINLAIKVVDEGMYYVPAEGEEIPPNLSIGQSSGEIGTGSININKADQSQLETLTGVGPVKAQKIIEYRDQHGGFKSIEEIMNVSGIGKKTFENIKDQISVN